MSINNSWVVILISLGVWLLILITQD